MTSLGQGNRATWSCHPPSEDNSHPKADLSCQTETRLLLLGDNFPELGQTTCLTKIVGSTSQETNQTLPVTGTV
jgi:hypothetical protein